MPQSILLVEDTPSLSMVYSSVLAKAGHDVDVALTFAEGHTAFTKSKHDIVLLDLLLPDGDGSDLMRQMLALEPSTKVIVITANGSINRAVEAMRAGAFDFLVKPFAETRLLSSVESALAANASPAAPAKKKLQGQGYHGFIGTSPIMQNIYGMIDNIGQSTATVFISGESGTGKEVCAQAIHDVSNRSTGPFVPLNCGAIPTDLLESEVFGHLRGSFTGAITNKMGAAEAADGGTLFLDEICEMDLALQTKLLRFLQTSTIQPVGATTAKTVNARIVCATNRDPMEQVRAGLFREDLYYRLHVVPIHLPPLRNRGEDVIEIASTILKTISAEESKSFEQFDEDVLSIFRQYSWPGNVRQLINALRNVVVLHSGNSVSASMLPAEIQLGDTSVSDNPFFGAATATPIARPSSEQGNPDVSPLVGQTLADVERELIEATIQYCGGSIPKAAHMLDVSASTIYRKREAWTRNETPPISA